jgi:hypothetical protein
LAEGNNVLQDSMNRRVSSNLVASTLIVILHHTRCETLHEKQDNINVMCIITKTAAYKAA